MVRRLVPIAAAAFALALAAAGCGGGDASTTTSTPAPPDAATQAGVGLDPVIGKWRGTGTEIQRTGTARSYRVVLDIAALDPHGAAGRVDYPSFPCGGTLRYVGRTQAGQVFRELIHSGKAKCARGGTITVKPRGRALDWTWEGEAGLIVEGMLRPA